MPRITHRFAFLSLVLLVAACATPKDDAAPNGETDAMSEAEPAPRVENETLAIAVKEVPEGFTLDVNEGDTMRFVRTDGGPGVLHVRVSPPQTAGVNLFEAIETHKEEILAKPEGDFSGSLELGGPLGPAYQSRGRFANEGGDGLTEDFRIFTIHPNGDRLLTLQYLYPAKLDMGERQKHLFAVLAKLEPI